MIFVTVGAQMGFDRLIRAIDEWAASQNDLDILAQIGSGTWVPRNMRWVRFMSPPEFRQAYEAAAAIIAHAGTGSIITALELRKPIIVMPRRSEMRETRNDHQIATARRFAALYGVLVASDEHELPQRLEELFKMKGGAGLGSQASPQLLAALRALVTAPVAEAAVGGDTPTGDMRHG